MQDISTEVAQTGRQREGVLSYWDFLYSFDNYAHTFSVRRGVSIFKHSWNLKRNGGDKKPFLFGKNNPN